MPIKTETIGKLIIRLFPNGFFQHGYYYLLCNHATTVAEKKAKSDFLKASIKENAFYHEDLKENKDDYKEYFDCIEGGYEAQYDKYESFIKKSISKNLDKKYVVPPLSPFDLFALTSTLLSISGAYHHFENAFEDKSFAPENTMKKLRRVVCDEISNWREIGAEWYSYPNKNNGLGPFILGNRSRNRNRDGDSDRDENKAKNAESLTTYWEVLLSNWDTNVYCAIAHNKSPPKWWFAAYSLMVISDEASKEIGFTRPPKEGNEENKGKLDISKKKVSLWSVLALMIIDAVNNDEGEDEEGGGFNKKSNKESINTERFKYVESLSIADRVFINILPKSRTAPLGCTLRRISHNLAQLPGCGVIRAGWAWAEFPKKSVVKNSVFNMLLIPYPYKIESKNFKATGISRSLEEQCNLTELRWGSFTLDVKENIIEDERFLKFVSRLIVESDKRVGITHAIVLPELALSRKTIIKLRDLIIEKHPSIELFCSGVREKLTRRRGEDGKKKEVPVNASYMASLNNHQQYDFLHEFFHEKHHKWRLTEDQIHDYDLSPALDPSRVWWEDLNIVNRRLPFLVMRDRWTVTSLICEDLARNDPARTVVEAIGPNLVISLLMDGPQIPQRWSARYATVLAEDPGSSVLSMTSLGLINRSIENKKGKDSRSFALWKDDTGHSQQITLDEGNHATVICVNIYPTTDYTMDGRADCRSISMRLTGQRQIRDEEQHKTGLYPPWGASD